MNEIHTLTVNGESYILRDAQTLAAVENLSNEVVINNTDRIEAEEALADRVTLLEQDYRHIATYAHTTEESVTSVSVTQDAEGNGFSCEDFLIFLTLPTCDDIIINYKTQLYIGNTLGSNWLVLFRQGFSRVGQRKWRIHLRHSHDGWWVVDAAQSEETMDCAINTTNNVFGSIKSTAQTERRVSQLHFATNNVAFPVGTVIEIYGK